MTKSDFMEHLKDLSTDELICLNNTCIELLKARRKKGTTVRHMNYIFDSEAERAVFYSYLKDLDDCELFEFVYNNKPAVQVTVTTLEHYDILNMYNYERVYIYGNKLSRNYFFLHARREEHEDE